MLAQFTEIELLFERLAKETTVTVHHDQLECMLAIACTFDHLLEDGSAIVARRRAALDELGDYRIALAPAPVLQLPALVWNRKVVLRLTARRDPHVQHGPRSRRVLFEGLIGAFHERHLPRP